MAAPAFPNTDYAIIEMTLDRSVNHSDDQGSFHKAVGFRHLRNLSFCGFYRLSYVVMLPYGILICLTSQLYMNGRMESL